MDRTRFTPSSPGKVLRIEGGKDWAFVPNDPPIGWTLPSGLISLYGDARDALGTLNGIGQLLPNPHLLLQPLQRREAISSSSIEGTYVTPEQLLLYELDPEAPRKPGDRVQDWREVANYENALIQGCKMLNSVPICNRVVKRVHSVLMTGVDGSFCPGEFRGWQVHIGSSRRFTPAPPERVESLMSSLERYLNNDRVDPLIRAFIGHYQFEAIHPFVDGNGRVGRSMLALSLYRWFSHAMPWLYMSAFFERFKDEYIQNLFKVSSEGAWEPWVEFCLRGTIEQAGDSIRRCSELRTLQAEYKGMLPSPTPRSHAILDGLFALPFVTIPSLADELNVSYPTAQKDVTKLLEAGILKESPSSFPRHFYAPEILRIAYSELDVVDGDLEEIFDENVEEV
jgi:Fic family protein